jgi:hypothetical protein
MFQPWGAFADPDAFYHAHASRLIAEYGPLHGFPWLDLTTLGTQFADQHFLFHVATIPFQWAFGEFMGAQVAAVAFAVLATYILFRCLHWLKVEQPHIWTMLLVLTNALTVRLSLGKASPFALVLFVIGLVATAKRAPWVAFLAGAAFALTHGGWILLLAAVGAFAVADIFAAYSLLRIPWHEAWRSSAASLVACTALGIGSGLLLHPNAATLLRFLWVQVVEIGVLTPFGQVALGGEWLPTPLPELLGALGPLLLATIPVVLACLTPRRTAFDQKRLRDAVGFALVAIALALLTLKSRRFVEYFLPAYALWLAALWTLADHEAFLNQGRALLKTYSSPLQRAMYFGVACLAILVCLPGWLSAYETLHLRARPFAQAKGAVAAIASHADGGERIFPSSWDLFPILFATDDRFRAVSGLDPTFLLKQHPALAARYEMLTHAATGTVADDIQQFFGSRFVLLDLPRAETLDTALTHDPRATRLFADENFRAYELVPSYPPR